MQSSLTSACSLTAPSAARRRMRWSRIETTSSEPSGIQPRPDGWPSTVMTSLLAPAGVDRDHAVAVEVRDPPAALVPARPLEEGPAVEQRADLALGHGGAETTLQRRADDRRGGRGAGHEAEERAEVARRREAGDVEAGEVGLEVLVEHGEAVGELEPCESAAEVGHAPHVDAVAGGEQHVVGLQAGAVARA